MAEYLPHQLRSSTRLIVGLYLIEKGADPTIKNRNQLSCIDHILNPNARTLVINYFNNKK